MNKPPNDGNPSAAGGFHYSDRRDNNNRSGKNHTGVVFSGNNNLPEDQPRRSGSALRGTSSTLKNQGSHPDSQVNRTAGGSEQNCGEEILPTGQSPAKNNPNSTEIVAASGSGNGPGRAIAASVVDSESGRKPARRGANRRPGRRPAAHVDDIIFPPKPNRQNRGIEAHSPAKREISKVARISSQPDRQPHWTEVRGLGPLYAALDLGTNNCRLLVALPQQAGRFRVVDAFSRIVRLGKGMEGSGRLDEDAMDRAVEALGECAEKLQNSNILKVRMIATEACRRAANGAQFLERVKSETGLQLEIVDRKTEAYLAAEGCGALVDKKADGAVLFDIGGGSSELILLDRRVRSKKKIHDQISSWTSLPVGVVTLSERHGGKEVTRRIFDQMVDEVRHHLDQFEGRENLKHIWDNGRVHLLGTSGTVTTLAGVHLNLPRYDRRQVDGIWLSDEEVENAIEQLIGMNYDQRAANACIGSERADLVLAGCAILQAIRQTWPAPRLRVADRGLREGILTQMMNQDNAWITNKKGRRNSSGRWRHRRRNPNRVNHNKPAQTRESQ